MGHLTISLSDEAEKKLRELAYSQFGNTKGSLSKVITNLLKSATEEKTRKQKGVELLSRLKKGGVRLKGLGVKAPSRSEIYGSRS